MGGQAFHFGVLQELVRQTLTELSVCLVGGDRLCRCDLCRMLGFAIRILQPTDVLLYYRSELHIRFPFFLKLTLVGDCDSPRDVAVSNDSLYYSTAVDIACDLFSK